MTSEMDDLFVPLTQATGTGAKPRCKRHSWGRFEQTGFSSETGAPIGILVDQRTCERCGATKDPVRSRRGRNNKNRGNAIQAQVCDMLGWLNIGGANGPADGISLVGDGLFIGQVKSGQRFPGWMANELAKLPRTGGRVPVLAIAETPGPGRKRRVLVVLEASDWVALHGGKDVAA